MIPSGLFAQLYGLLSLRNNYSLYDYTDSFFCEHVSLIYRPISLILILDLTLFSINRLRSLGQISM